MKKSEVLLEKLSSAYRITAFYTQYVCKKCLYIIRRKLPTVKKFYIKSFPAVHFKKMDTWDYVLTFSSEITIVTIAIFIASLNFYFFTLQPTSTDQSLASTLLAYHHKEGDKVYGKLASIKTVVEHTDSPFISQAYAETTPFLESVGSEDVLGAEDNLVVSDGNTFVRPNPDTVSELVAKQIKVHTVLPDETLGSIARKYSISIDTIIWANKLPGSKVKPGWELLILPTDGVLVKADSNTTLPDIAFKYKCNLDTIIAYNGLDGADDIEEGKIIIAPGCKVQPPVQTAKPTPKNDPKKPGTKTTKLSQLGKHIFPSGYCTYYVASRMEIDFGGNANAWPSNAAAAGYVVTKVPSVGSAVVTTDGPRRYGHVAFVERVTDDYIEVAEMNFVGFNKISRRKIPIGSRSIVRYILPK